MKRTLRIFGFSKKCNKIVQREGLSYQLQFFLVHKLESWKRIKQIWNLRPGHKI